ncbi:MAG: hypothetical protein U0894_01620 [Pirellulales bacterium]
MQGAVVGINTWVDPQSGYSFALDASALQTLLASLPKAADDSDTPPITPLLDLASPSVKRNYLLWQPSETLKQLRDTTRQFQFSPKSQQQYEQMQRLAMVVTIAQQPELLQADEDHQSSLDELAREAADQTLAELEKQKRGRDIGFLPCSTEFASQSITRPMTGQFFLATTQRIVRSDKGRRQSL